MRLLRAAFLPASLVVIVVAAATVPLPLYLEQPGRLLPLASCVRVEAGAGGDVDGDYLLTTVHLTQATLVDSLRGAVDEAVAVLPKGDIVPSGQLVTDYFRHQREVFASTVDIAAAVGLRAAGMVAELSGEGVLVVRTIPDTPAHGVLAAGDVITAVGGRPVAVDADLRAAVAAAPPDAPVPLVFRRAGDLQEVALTPPVEVSGARIIGIEPQTYHQRVELPVPVAVESGRITGPSAGLMIALTVFDKVDAVDLADGRRIAGTGTIDFDGNVGPVGSIGLKVRGAETAGVDVFLAPGVQVAEARAALAPDSDVELIGVHDFDAALEALSGAPGSPQARAGAPGSCPEAGA